MTASEVIDALKDTAFWADAPIPARKTFIGQMKYRQYGVVETRDAWAWYIAGWTDRNEAPDPRR
jgi:hypothetical protein